MATRGTADADLTGALLRAVEALAGGSDQRFGVAVSGGPDSMALLDLSARAFPGRVEAATVDHGLRPESADEAAMVARWCGEQGIAHVTLRPEQGVQGNVQQWARRQRYALLDTWRAERRLDWIFTAHHADDQLETMLMRLNRGAGVNGLAGVRARQGHVLRPLLGVRREQLLAYAGQRRIPYVEDPSNSDRRYDRAAIREQLRGADWLGPLAAVRSAAAMAEAEEALNWAAGEWVADRVQAHEGGWRFDPQKLPREIVRRVVLTLLDRVDPGARAPRGDALDHALAAAGRGEQVSLGAALLKGGAVWLIRAAPPRN